MIKDRFLVLSVAFMIAIDLLILIMYYLVEGIERNLTVSQIPHTEEPVKMKGVSSWKKDFF